MLYTIERITMVKKILRLSLVSLSIFALVVSVSACAKKSDDAKDTPVAEKKYWPLTHVETKKLENRPAVSVKIENDPEARPQTGLENADIVWETMVEGGVTRFIAVYNSDIPETVGPVRSLRVADGSIVAPMKGLIVFSGSNGSRFQQVAEDAGSQIVEEDRGAKGFFRDGDNAPHNDFFKLGDAISQADEKHKDSPKAQFDYVDEGEQSTAGKLGEPLKTMTNVMSSGFITGWNWDSSTKTFFRTQDGDAFLGKTGKQIAAKNVIAIEVPTSGTPEIDPAGNPEMDMQVVGSGVGSVATDGKYIPVKWSKKSAEDLLKLTTKDDKEVKLDAGNTWIVLVPKGSGSISVDK
jgi:hypothetical protein